MKHLLLLTLAACSLHGTVLRQYDASLINSPSAQGWSANFGVLSGANVTELGQPAWQMTGDNCCGYWYSGLSNAEWNEAFDSGWSFSATTHVSTSTGFGYLFLDVPGSGPWNRFDLVFGFDGTNSWAGLSNWFDGGNPALKTTLPGNVFHHLEMRYDPGTQTAGLWVDGVQTLSGYTGHTEFRQGGGPGWGVTGHTNDAFFAGVTFTSTPEPGTWAFVASGLAALAVRQRRWSA